MDEVIYLENNVISFPRGDTFSFVIEITTEDGLPYELKENDKLVFSVKKTSKQKEFLIKKEIDSSLTVTLNHEDTSNLPFGTYVYDVQLTSDVYGTKTLIEPTNFILRDEVNWDE